ncbi:MAG: YbjN domain-containing protein [Cyanobacteria bacterium SZAS LIN-3]|nr:YbjN domain-containing protein [Cyanobacteria bacterium SZAS LIN-3]MBS2007869.1 YbjN domain-containing protein [Cyanobacteria bacterium SZAS TMP-1]
MGLFGTEKHAGLTSQAKAMVEAYFSRRNLDPHQHELKDAAGMGWWLVEGSAKIYIYLLDNYQGATLRITSPIVQVPEKNLEAFYRHLLDINGTLSSCALSTHENLVLVVAQRPTFGLVQEELDDLVWHVAYVADQLDNKLADQFGCRMYSG